MKTNLFDGVIILALDKRKEYWKELVKQCESLGLETTTFIAGDGSDLSLKYDIIDEPNPNISGWGYGVPHLKHHHYNAFKTHQGMVRLAKKMGYKRVLFLEDDAILLKRFEDIVSKIEGKNIDNNSWLVFYMGWWYNDENDDWNRDVELNYRENGIVEVEEVNCNIGGLHGVIFQEPIYDLLLSLPPNNPIDTQLCYNRHWVPSLMVKPKAIHVKSIFSYTEGVTFIRKVLE